MSTRRHFMARCSAWPLSHAAERKGALPRFRSRDELAR
jgi:hypothetical protein